jgi:hypothetical protein
MRAKRMVGTLENWKTGTTFFQLKYKVDAIANYI